MVKQAKTSQTLQVLLNGICVGQLKKTSQNKLSFKYHETWLKTYGARPISLSLPLISTVQRSDAVFHFFNHLLPDSPKVRARIQALFKTSSNHPFDLLKAIGKDCIGALQFVSGRVPSIQRKIRYEVLSELELSQRLGFLEKHPLGMSPGLDTFHVCLPGQDDKAAFLFINDKWARPRDKTPTTHIFKQARANIPYHLEIAWLSSKIAASFGLPVANSYLMHFGQTQTLVVERFDRQLSSDKSWIMRLPQETLAQALGLSSQTNHSIQSPKSFYMGMQVLLGSDNPIYDRDLFFCGFVIHALLGSTENYFTNWSLFILPHGKFRLTPIYDIQADLHSTKQPCMNRNQLLNMVKQARYSPARASLILDDVLARVESVILDIETNVPHAFPKTILQSIAHQMRVNAKALSKLTEPVFVTKTLEHAVEPA